MATGPLTSDGVPLDVLRTRRLRALDEYNSAPSIRDLFCESTWQDYFYLNQNAKAFQLLSSDTERPHRQSVDEQYITLNSPKKYGLAGGVTQDAIHNGVSELQVMDEHESALQADIRLQNQLIWKECFTDGGWWDATAAPPRYGNNTMASSHDHYVGANNSGAMLLADVAAAKEHILEHGFGSNIVCFLSGTQITKLEVQAEYNSAVANKTPLLNRLQEFGFTSNIEIDGVPMIRNDYIPANYAMFIDLGASRKPLAWRSGKLPNTPDNLMMWKAPEDMAYYMNEEYVRWGAATVQMRSLGVAYYFSSGTYTAPTVTEWAAI